MKKSLLVIVGIGIITVLILVYAIYNHQSMLLRTKQENEEYEKYTTNTILGSSLMTLINKVEDSNTKNEIEKDDNGLYIANDTNSIIIEVKFSEADTVFRMEAISKLGPEEFIKNYNTMSFKCIKKEYHSKTNSISYLYFEQV